MMAREDCKHKNMILKVTFVLQGMVLLMQHDKSLDASAFIMLMLHNMVQGSILYHFSGQILHVIVYISVSIFANFSLNAIFDGGRKLEHLISIKNINEASVVSQSAHKLFACSSV